MLAAGLLHFCYFSVVCLRYVSFFALVLVCDVVWALGSLLRTFAK